MVFILYGNCVFLCKISPNEGHLIIIVAGIVITVLSVNQINLRRNQDAFTGLWSSFHVQTFSVT